MRTIQELAEVIHAWAPKNVPDAYWHGTRQEYWSAALHAKIITQHEYDFAAAFHANLWTHRYEEYHIYDIGDDCIIVSGSLPRMEAALDTMAGNLLICTTKEIETFRQKKGDIMTICIYPDCAFDAVENYDGTVRWCDKHFGFYPHKCEEHGCSQTVMYDDEPKCFVHSPDEGSSVRGYSAHAKATNAV